MCFCYIMRKASLCLSVAAGIYHNWVWEGKSHHEHQIKFRWNWIWLVPPHAASILSILIHPAFIFLLSPHSLPHSLHVKPVLLFVLCDLHVLIPTYLHLFCGFRRKFTPHFFQGWKADNLLAIRWALMKTPRCKATVTSVYNVFPLSLLGPEGLVW